MAKSSLTLTCARCGNTFKHIHFSHNRSEANSYEKWAEENITICPDCYAAEKAAKMKTEVEAYMASFGGRQLPQITGVSAKQIAYAEKLRSAYVADLMRAKVDISAFFQALETVQLQNLDSANLEKARAAASKEGKSLEDWIAGYRLRVFMRHCNIASSGDVDKIQLIFKEANASKLIDALKGGVHNGRC